MGVRGPILGAPGNPTGVMAVPLCTKFLPKWHGFFSTPQWQGVLGGQLEAVKSWPQRKEALPHTPRIHVWYIYLHLVDFLGSTLNFLGLNTSPSVIHCQFLRFSTKIPLQRLVPLGALPLIGVDRSGGIKQSYLESLHGVVFQWWR